MHLTTDLSAFLEFNVTANKTYGMCQMLAV